MVNTLAACTKKKKNRREVRAGIGSCLRACVVCHLRSEEALLFVHRLQYVPVSPECDIWLVSYLVEPVTSHQPVLPEAFENLLLNDGAFSVSVIYS